jgi:pimeloyl-ACP methyl ester carboxylesterase
MQTIHKIRHRQADVDGLDVFFREAGDPNQPTVLLLHGFPNSSHGFREVMPPLADVAHVVAPDLPGFGLSSSPTVHEYRYTFENLSWTIENLLHQLGVERFFVYLHDFGAPVGYHLATRAPDRIRGLIVQSGNAHHSGLGPQWDTMRKYWAEPTPEGRDELMKWLSFEGTRRWLTLRSASAEVQAKTDGISTRRPIRPFPMPMTAGFTEAAGPRKAHSRS